MSIFDGSGGQIETILSQKELLGLSSQLKDKTLPQESIVRLCDVLNSFKLLALKFVPESEIFAFTTSVFRKMDDWEDVFAAIRERTGITPERLSGKEEARLDFVGVSHSIPDKFGMLVDTGGGSTELVSFENGAIDRISSVPVGCLQLWVKHVRALRVTDSIQKDILGEIEKALDKFDWPKKKYPTLIGVGGTARTALKMSKALFGTHPESSTFPVEHLKAMRKDLKKSSPSIYQTLYREAPDRIVTFYPGLLILEEAAKRAKSKQMLISVFGVREGFYIDRVLKQGSAPGDNQERPGSQS
jgi:exopolyphosphatase/guanosine-5'-triphosphate,3'-diphosphate pyrophosphatase